LRAGLKKVNTHRIGPSHRREKAFARKPQARLIWRTISRFPRECDGPPIREVHGEMMQNNNRSVLEFISGAAHNLIHFDREFIP
jgi:hypothetical protein